MLISFHIVSALMFFRAPIFDQTCLDAERASSHRGVWCVMLSQCGFVVLVHPVTFMCLIYARHHLLHVSDDGSARQYGIMSSFAFSHYTMNTPFATHVCVAICPNNRFYDLYQRISYALSLRPLQRSITIHIKALVTSTKSVAR